jgi:hypothetical protein
MNYTEFLESLGRIANQYFIHTNKLVDIKFKKVCLLKLHFKIDALLSILLPLANQHQFFSNLDVIEESSDEGDDIEASQLF